jgi:uncharacterized protein (TIGR02145 family)
MKSIFKILIIIMAIVFNFSCKKKDTVLISPTVETTAVSEVLYATATSGGIVADDGAPVVVRGVCWGTDSMPTIENSRTTDGSGSGGFTSSIAGLNFGKSYHVRAYAMNNFGTSYGTDLAFITKTMSVTFNPSLIYGTIEDIDGMSYKTVQIGSQVWMAENLKTSRFNDGTSIPNITNNAQWTDINTPAYCWFNNNDTLYKNIYGAYYNWFAVSSGKLCPVGWHVPSDTEWQLLIDFLGGSNSAGSKIKETGTNNWIFSNSDATNISGFTALPAGQRSTLDGTFNGQGNYGGWWSTTELEPSPLSAAWCRWIHGDTTVVARNEIYKKDGFSVRCVKD